MGNMTADEFKAVQSDLGMNNQQISDALGVSLSTVTKWRAGSHPIPRTAQLAIKYLKTQGAS